MKRKKADLVESIAAWVADPPSPARTLRLRTSRFPLNAWGALVLHAACCEACGSALRPGRDLCARCGNPAPCARPAQAT